TITYGINYGGSKMDPPVFRLVNLIIHSVNAAFLFLIAWELGAPAGLQNQQRFWLALLAGSLFAVHPLLTESVTYISGRSSSLCALFYFAGLWAALRAGRVQTNRRWIFLLLVIVCTGLGWLVKQEAVTLPAAAIVLIWL